MTETRARNEMFGSSLLLANSPMSPKIVNGSFAAMFDVDGEMVTECGLNFAHLRLGHKNSPGELVLVCQKQGPNPPERKN